jgi:Protein of unknown function (DUF664)
MASLPDGRSLPPAYTDERATLEAWLDFQRATLELKCANLDDRQLRLAAVPPSPMTLLGLVQHMANVERNWFGRLFADGELPPLYPDGGGFDLAPDRGIEEALTVWREETARGREAIAGLALDGSVKLFERAAGYIGAESVSLRWVLTYVLGEYARHNGHADLLRECIDGVTGM